MYTKRTLFIVATVLLAEAIAVVALPLRIPRPARAIIAATNAIAIAALWLLSRRKFR